MTRVVGLDPSLTAFGLASVVAPRTVPVLHRVTSRLRGHERLALILHEVGNWCEDAELAVMEGLSFGAKGSALLDLAGLHWLVRQMLWEANIPYAIIAPAQLKQWATGRGDADKIAMAVEAARRFRKQDLRLTDSDVVDALWLAAAGCQHTGQPLVKMPQAQVDVLTSKWGDKRRKGQPKIAWPIGLADTDLTLAAR